MISNKSSSFHTISGDYNPGILKKIFWLIINFIINNLSVFYKKDKNLKIGFFKNQDLTNQSKIRKDYTPSRKISDLFWYDLPVSQILNNFKEINVLDIGCGNGIYYNLLKEIFRHNLKTYTGFDKNLRIDEKIKSIKNTNFIQDDVSQIKKYLKNHNFIISQSFIEHIKYDLKFFENLKYFEDANIPSIQIHLFPSNPCLYLYLAHGIRHYNLGSISKISRIYSNQKTKKLLISLGSKNINLLHFKELTLKRLFRSKNLIEKGELDLFHSKFLDSFNKDCNANKKNKINNAAFYALILQTNLKKEIEF